MTDAISNRLTSGPLITTDWVNRSFDFYSMDTKELYQKNSDAVVRSGNNWIYLNKHIHYKFNSQGYRTKEWTDINWQESVVVFGCSIVLGEGLAEEDTITAQLSKLLNRPVINLGVSGTGIFFNFYNSVMLGKNLPTPYAVVQIWPIYTRMELFRQNGFEIHIPNLVGKDTSTAGKYKDAFFTEWIRYPENTNSYAWLMSHASRMLWSNKTQYCDFSLDTETATLMNCQTIKWADYARDLGHPGIETAKQVAVQISKNIS